MHHVVLGILLGSNLLLSKDFEFSLLEANFSSPNQLSAPVAFEQKVYKPGLPKGLL